MKSSSRALALSVALLSSACGSSDGEPTIFTNEAPPEVLDEDAVTPTTAPDASEAPLPEETAEPEAAAGSIVRVSGGSTEPWEIGGYCEWTPDNTGGASSLYVVEDTEDDRTEGITVLEVWPVSVDEDSETSIIGSIEEPDGNLLVVIGVESSFDGETITLMADVHSGLKGADDPPDYTLTITCAP